MQLSLDLDEFNLFLMLYMKAIVTNEVDYNKGLLEYINKYDSPEARILFEARSEEIDNNLWNSSKEKDFINDIHRIMPQYDIKSIEEFDGFVKLLEDRNLKTWLIQRFYRQNPKMRVYLKRFITQIENKEEIKIRLLL